MSLMDDIFDIGDAVKDTDNEGAWDRLIEYINACEARVDELYEERKHLLAAVRVLKKMGNEE